MTTDAKTHDCFKRLDEQLKQYNTKIAQAYSFDNPERELIQVATVKADSNVRVKPRALYATFCPFCGVKLKGAT